MIEVEVALARPVTAVLALKAVADHQVLAREAHGEARRALVAQEVQHARHADRATDDRQVVVVELHGSFRQPSKSWVSPLSSTACAAPP